MKKTSLLAAALWLASNVAAYAATPAPLLNAPTAQDRIEIDALLANYTDSVSTGDRVRFESRLLDVNIPFAAVSANGGAKTVDLKSIQDYAGFRKAIFDGGQQFHQRFSNVKIEQLGNLAQVSLDYETALQGTEYAGKGWKVMELIKVNGQWKIASEFFTGYPAR
jgi:hypothetical protein